MAFSDALQVQALECLFQGLVIDLPSPLYLALHNAAPNPAGDQTVNETTYQGYARLAVFPSPSTFAVSAGPPARAQNVQGLSFAPCTGLGDVLSFWSLGTAAAGPDSLLTYGPIGPGAVYGFAADAMDECFVPLLPDGTTVGQAFTVGQFGPGVLLPGGLTDGQIYYASSVMTQSLLLSATQGGPAIGFTTPGSGLLYPVTPMTVSQGQVPTFPPNSLLTFQG